MNHWLAVFNEVTWDEFLAMSPKVYAFAEPFDRRVPGIRLDDRLLCYVAKKMVWAGVLRVVGDRYRESTTIFTGGDFPIRYPVEPEIALTVAEALPMSALEGRLSFFPSGGTWKNWSPYLQKSPRKLRPIDGDALLEALVGNDPTRS